MTHVCTPGPGLLSEEGQGQTCLLSRRMATTGSAPRARGGCQVPQSSEVRGQVASQGPLPSAPLILPLAGRRVQPQPTPSRAPCGQWEGRGECGRSRDALRAPGGRVGVAVSAPPHNQASWPPWGCLGPSTSSEDMVCVGGLPGHLLCPPGLSEEPGSEPVVGSFWGETREPGPAFGRLDRVDTRPHLREPDGLCRPAVPAFSQPRNMARDQWHRLSCLAERPATDKPVWSRDWAGEPAADRRPAVHSASTRHGA